MPEPTSNILFPQINLSTDEKLWLQTVYAKFEAGQKPESAEILVELWGKVAEDFNYTSIDRRLLRNGTELTLLGVVHVDVATGILSATHRVITFIQQLIKNNPKLISVTAEQISINTSIAKNEVKRILVFICDFRDFWNGASGDKSLGYESIQVNSEHVKRAYLSYKGLEQVLDAFYEAHEPKPPTGGVRMYESSVQPSPSPGYSLSNSLSPVSADLDLQFMRLALEQARKSRAEDNRIHPLVGAVVVKDNSVLATAFRGEADQGDHAEFIALEKKLAGHGCWWTADTRRGRGGAPVLYFRKWNGRS